MADPTEAEIQDQLKRAIHWYESLREAGEESGAVTDTLLSIEDGLFQALEGDYNDQIVGAILTSRSRVDGALRDAANAVFPILLQYAKFLDVPERTAQGILGRIYDHFIKTGQTIKTRAFTYGTPVASGTNVGNGVIKRLTTDFQGFDIENVHQELKRAECFGDAATGSFRHEERFQFIGEEARRDSLELKGSGRSVEIRALSARDSLLINPSFSSFGGSAINSLTSIGGWTATTDITVHELIEGAGNFYRDFQGDTNPRAFQFNANDKLSQALTVRNTVLNANTPYYLQIAYNRELGAGDGTLTIRMGSTSKSVVLAAQTGWNILSLDIDQNLWTRNFNEADLDIEIELSGNTTGSVAVDDVLFVPWAFFDGSWWLVIGGDTKFALEDKFVMTDTATDAVIQRWLFRMFGRFLPHDAAPSIADP